VRRLRIAIRSSSTPKPRKPLVTTLPSSIFRTTGSPPAGQGGGAVNGDLGMRLASNSILLSWSRIQSGQISVAPVGAANVGAAPVGVAP
jgi:hypothetical protein